MTKILLRRDSNVNLQGVVLSSGEPAIALDLNILKIGDGSTAWENLDPIGDSGSLSAAGVSSLNGLTGGVSIAEGTDIQVNVAGSSITISYTGTGGGGGVVTETDPIFTGSAAYNITNTDISNWNSTYNSDIVVSGDNISLLNNDAGYLDAHPTIAGAGPSSDSNTGNTFVQNITVDSFGHITDITTAVATSGSAGASGITAVIEDTSPQLGGNLDLNSNNITGNGDVNITGNITAYTGNLDVLSFNVNNESVLTKGQISWNDTEGSVSIGLTDNSEIHIGEHNYFRVRNVTGGPLYKGQAVYATGVHANGIITPAKYVADGSIREIRFIGIVLENINDNNNGYVVNFGHIHDIDLRGSVENNFAVGDETWNNGDILYVHPTVAGKLTNVEPKHSISVAIILDTGTGADDGRMFVRPESYGHLNDNHDVNISGISSRDVLVYNTGTEYWENNSNVIFQQDNIGLLDGNIMYDYTLSGGTVGTLNPSSSTVKVNILRINPSAELIIQGIIPPSDGSAKIYDRFTLINISDNTVKLKHNSGTTINRIWLDSSVSDGVETVLRKGESAELYYVNGTFDSVSSSRWLCHLNQNELNGDVVAGTGISLTYTTGVNELEISTNLYSAPDGIAGASGVNNIVVMSSGDYTALATKNPTTLYFIK